MKGIFLSILLIGTLLLGACGTSTSIDDESDTSIGEQTPTYELQLLSTNFERSYSYITMSGQVKNISSSNLENILAVISYYTEDDTFVKTADALIDYNPILPGQISPFEVITTDNPAITRFSISFKYLLGGTISYEDKR